MKVLIREFKRLFVLFLLLSFVSGCASKSESIKSSYVSPLEYQSYNCEQVGEEMSRVGRRLSEVSANQDKTATKDTVAMSVGMVLFWPSLFFLAAGDDREEEIARLKGEAEALEQCAIKKQCTKILAQIEESRKLLDEQEKTRKEIESLVDEKYDVCVSTYGPNDCNKDTIRTEIEQERADSKTLLASNQPAIEEASPTDSAALESSSKEDLLGDTENNTEVYKVKCGNCGNILSYKAKYSGTSTKCMQCDHVVELL